MDWNRVEGNWKQVKGKVKEKWGQLTDDDLDVISGRRDQLEGKIQERYGLAKDQVRGATLVRQNPFGRTLGPGASRGRAFCFFGEPGSRLATRMRHFVPLRRPCLLLSLSASRRYGARDASTRGVAHPCRQRGRCRVQHRSFKDCHVVPDSGRR